jgi:bifunctional non-homologous end joining protein LigD
MLAEKMDVLIKRPVSDWNEWVAEEKYDGHRSIIEVSGEGAFRAIAAYNRPRKASKDTMTFRALPHHLVESLALLPAGIYDGELMAGDTATDVKRLDLESERFITLFDVLRVNEEDVMTMTTEQRRDALDMCHAIMLAQGGNGAHVKLSQRFRLLSEQTIMQLAKKVWARGGEGLILKRRAATYQSNKRSNDWVKIKRLEHFTLTVTGFEATRGTVLKRGPFAIVHLIDDDGKETRCKTKDDFELARLERAWDNRLATHKNNDPQTGHPWVGRKLVIECGGRTRDGGYKGPVIWDRWENE